MSFTRTWDETGPLGTAAANTLETIIQQFKTDVRERVSPALTLVPGTEAADKIIITISAKDINATAWAETRLLLRIWISDSAYGAETSEAPTVTIDTGTLLQAVTANKHSLVIASATGVVGYGVTITGAKTLHLMAEVDGRVYTSGAVTWAA